MKDKNILLGMNESLGLPYYFNHPHKQCIQDDLLETIEQKLKASGNNMLYCNQFSMLFNKTWHIDSYLKNNLSFAELESIKKSANNFARHSFFTKIGMPPLNTESVTEKPAKEDHLVDQISKSLKPLILYGSGVNNFMHYFRHNFFVAWIKPWKTKKVLKQMINEEWLNTVLDEVRQNLTTLLSINSNSKIYLIEFSLNLYTPPLPLILWKKKKSFKIVSSFLTKYQNKIWEICNELGITYIPLDQFNHPKKAINIVSSKIVEHYLTSKSDKHCSKKTFSKSGIDGMIEEIDQMILSVENENIFPNDKVKQKQKNSRIKTLKTERMVLIESKKEKINFLHEFDQ